MVEGENMKNIMEEALDEVNRKGRLDIQKRVFGKMRHKDPLAELSASFAKALLEKLLAAKKKYGHQDDWMLPDWEESCRKQLLEHVAKGDPLDVAAYAAFCWHHGWSTSK